MTITLVPGFNPNPYTGAGNNTYLISGREPTLIDAGVGRFEHVSAVRAALDGVCLARVLVTHGVIQITRPELPRWPPRGQM